MWGIYLNDPRTQEAGCHNKTVSKRQKRAGTVTVSLRIVKCAHRNENMRTQTVHRFKIITAVFE